LRRSDEILRLGLEPVARIDGGNSAERLMYYAIMELRLLQQNANIVTWVVKRFDPQRGSLAVSGKHHRFHPG
jgi:hypothetical protein